MISPCSGTTVELRRNIIQRHLLHDKQYEKVIQQISNSPCNLTTIMILRSNNGASSYLSDRCQYLVDH